jgi:hypothetical protein
MHFTAATIIIIWYNTTIKIHRHFTVVAIIVVIYQIMIIVAAVKCLCIIFYSGNIPNYDNCSCCKMPMYYI